MIDYLWRKLTDRKVYCQHCLQPLGYVPWRVARQYTWEHVICPVDQAVRAIPRA